MPRYVYQARSQAGQNVQGEIDAGSDAEARVILRTQKMIPTQVVLKSGEGNPLRGGLRLARSSGKRIKNKDLQIFTRQFSTLVSAGIPVVQSLDMLAGGTLNPEFQSVIQNVSRAVGQGKRLGDAMEEQAQAFDRLYVNIVRAGEEGGVLDVVLARLAQYLEKAAGIRRKVLGALIYPAAIVFVAVVVMAIILTFVIPKFKDLFAKSGQQLPAITQMVIGISDTLVSHYVVIFGGLGALIFLSLQYYRTDEGQKKFDQFIMHVPLFGHLVQRSAIARFTRTLATLLGAGVAILDALDISAKTVGNSVIEEVLQRVKAAVTEGKSITVPLSREPFIPNMVTQMIGVGEQTGALDTMLSKVADFYEDEVDVAVQSLTSSIEPLLMVILGSIIACLVIAMYLPIFSLSGAVGR